MLRRAGAEIDCFCNIYIYIHIYTHSGRFCFCHFLKFWLWGVPAPPLSPLNVFRRQ